MNLARYHMTPTAESHLWAALGDSYRRWGEKRTEKYRVDFLAGLQYIADNHEKLNSPHRAALAAGTEFSLHLVEHRYVAFQVHDVSNIIVVGIFHEKMNVPSRLQELNAMSSREIDEVRRVIGLAAR